jgi:protein-S-isoprenylcysteine O-methyltransferase Ste14
MKSTVRVIGRLSFMSIPFIAAGTLRWTRGWIWLGLLLFSLVVIFAVAHAKNPGLMKARLNTKAPTKLFDKVFVALYIASALGFFVTAGLDARFGWSHLSFAWVYAGVALHLAALVPLIAVVATNPFLEGTVRIQSERGHVAITSGPYAIVRHPMYVGIIFLFLASPLVLGSLWAYIPVVGIAVAFVFRTAHEDRTLLLELPGYADYVQRTKYRLVPGLW